MKSYIARINEIEIYDKFFDIINKKKNLIITKYHYFVFN